MTMAQQITSVEQKWNAAYGLTSSFANELVTVVEAPNVHALGKIVALRFIEFCQTKPNGVIALPTGKSPEMVLKYLVHYQENWGTAEVMHEMATFGIKTSELVFPDTSNLRFVQLDEFFPMLPTHRNSFCKYIRTFYLPLLKIKPENYHSIDLFASGVVTEEEINREFPDGRFTEEHWARIGTSDLMKRVMQFCQNYEEKIRSWGGIDFFLGGIGPDGHIAFNQPGSTADTRTRLVRLEYMTAAHAAGDLGGIERARQTAAITIGLGTISYNKDATVIIMAAGEGKAYTIKDAVCQPISDEYPATHLRSVKGLRFYLSKGASKHLNDRYGSNVIAEIDAAAADPVDHRRRIDKARDFAMNEHSIASNKPVSSFPYTDATKTHAIAKLLIERNWMDDQAGRLAVERLTHKLSAGLAMLDGNFEKLIEEVDAVNPYDKESPIICGPMQHKAGDPLRILHTAPHHDDIMLSYHPPMKHLLENSKVQNRFVYLTSGFHSVTDDYLKSSFERIFKYPKDGARGFIKANEAYVFRSTHTALIKQFATAHKAKDEATKLDVEAVLVLRHLALIYGVMGDISPHKKVEIDEVTHKLLVVATGTMAYLNERIPGDATPKDIQQLKGMVRETEAERMWALRGVSSLDVHHLRSSFYTDAYFTPLPTIEDDAMPLVALMEEFKPHVVTVAYDPEGTGPDTHYKVLQVVSEAVKIVQKKAEDAVERGAVGDVPLPVPFVWGYRNVWFRFDWHDCNVVIPVADLLLAELHDAFMSCFVTQKFASFPSPYYDGPFSEWAIQIILSQGKQLKQLLGAYHVENHPDKRVATAAGFILLKQMTAKEFGGKAAELKQKLGFN